MTIESSRARPASMWKRALSTFLDLLTAFFVIGYLIGLATGKTTAGGFKLEGGSALALFALIVGYFVIGRLFVGGTLWDRILGIARPQPK